MANWQKVAGAIGDSFKGISSATGAATGNTTKWEPGTIGEGNLSTKEETKPKPEENNKDVVKEDVVSDENLKDRKYCQKHFSDCIANIDAYLFRYKNSAQKKLGLDDKEHVGVMAQELASNPVTEKSVVNTGDHLEVNTPELTMENTAVLADLVRRIQALEAKIGE